MINVKFSDIVGNEVLGFSSSENIENFSSQDVSEEIGNISLLTEVKTYKTFNPKEVWFFDSTSSLDFVLMTRKGILGFVTVALGVIKTQYKMPIPISDKSIEYDVKRFIILPEDLGNFPSLVIDNSNCRFDFIVIRKPRINRVEVLWKEVFLKEILPRLEKDFIIDRLSSYLSDEVILIKDGLLGEIVNSNSCRYIFGHVKNFSFPEIVFDDDRFRSRDKRTGIYVVEGGRGFHSYINLGYPEVNRPFINVNRGTYNYSRVDLAGYSLNEVEEIVARYEFIADYLIYLTTLFSNSQRFPQNVPIIEFLESFLRNASGNKEIVKRVIEKVVAGDIEISIP
ncbi:MAG: hypothetical protein ACPL4C_03975 [Brevinematia bacterium]